MGMAGIEKVLLLVVTLWAASVEWHILVQVSVSACVTPFLWLQAGHVPCCFVVLCARGDAPLAADWKRSEFHFTCTAKGVFKQCILAAGELNGVQMQHSKLEQVSSDSTIRLWFSGSRVYLLGLINSPDPVLQGIPSA